ncbi:2-dehydro-3-deoxygalactonokinase [Siculibacillus lacustris]|nr:2-dehydro-3-deoxygalactonokinase [Siculibacillus lacustris]
MQIQPSLVAVDWGLSWLRIWAVAADGTVLAEYRSKDGFNVVPKDGFEAILRDRLVAMGVRLDGAGPALPVIACSMVGARNGWKEAGYIDVPAPLDRLAAGAVRVEAPGLDVRILPGLARRDRARADVMRGEETELLGITLARPGLSGTVVLPGTHSKWVTLDRGSVVDFITVMTGELFAVLTEHSLLRHTVGGARPSADPKSPAFRRGLLRGLARPAGVAAAAFSMRATGLLFDLPGEEIADELSGILIGAEIGHRMASANGLVTLVCSGPLSALYEAGFDAAQVDFDVIDAETLAFDGLVRAARSLWPDLIGARISA